MIKDEFTLVKEVKENSRESFNLLYNRWVSRLYSFIYHYVKSEEITDDILQETFMRIWLNREKLDTSRPFKSYLFTISYNCLLKELKHQLNNPLMDEYVAYQESLSTSADEVNSKMEYDQFQLALNEAKLKLTPRQREIFELNKEYDLSVAEIAEQLHITEQVVRNQLSTSLRILRVELKRYYFFFLLYMLGL